MEYAYEKSPFYHRMFNKADVKPEDIKALVDLRKKIPIFRKDDVRANVERTGNPFAEMLTVPVMEIDMIFSSTGTTGTPTLTGLTEDEVEIFREFCVRSAWMQKIRPHTRVINIVGFSLPINMWHWCIDYHAKGVEKMPGCEVIPGTYMGSLLGVSALDEAFTKFEAQSGWSALDQLYAITDECTKKNIDPKDIMKLKHQGVAGESSTPLLKKKLAEELNLKDPLYDYVGVSEVQGMKGECYVHDGSHLWADGWLMEIIDPETGELLGSGEREEYVCTKLFAKGIPWIRYATEDYIQLIDEKCKCGRTHPRSKVLGRVGWMLTIKDKKISPFDVALIFEEYPETEEAIFNLLKYSEQMDKLKIRACYDTAITKDPDGLRTKLVQDFKQKYGIDAEIEWVPYEKIEKILHKIKRVVDLT